MTNGKRFVAATMSCVLLAACGAVSPEIKEAWDGEGKPGDPSIKKPPFSATAQIEFEIRRKIYCELRTAVVHVNDYPYTAFDQSNTLLGKRLMIPKEWIAQLSLSLQVDESTALAPGVSYNQVMRNAVATFGVGNTITQGQSFNLGFGGTVSATATRNDKFNPTYSIAWLMNKPTDKDNCRPENDIFQNDYPRSSPFLIESELGIEKWLLGAMLAENLLPSQPPIVPQQPAKRHAGGSPMAAMAADPGGGGGDKGGGSLGPFSVSTELKFVIITSGNITPTWKLLQVSANTSGNLFAAGRTRTHDLIITIGPPTQDTASANFALQVQSAVATGLRSAIGP